MSLPTDMSKWILPAATAMGAFSVFPEQPMFIKNLARNELFKYFCLFTLIWQGGGGQNVKVAGIMTIAIFLLLKIMG